MKLGTITLANRYLVATFSADTGNLLGLCPPRCSSSLITHTFCKYSIGKESFSEDPQDFQSKRPETVRLENGRGWIKATIHMAHLSVTKTFRLRPNHPLLEITYAVHGTAPKAKLQQPAFPCILFAEDINDITEDDHILDFDGAELGNGRELPCWRVFFRKGHRDGLLLAARCKEQMSHIQTCRKGLDILPHIMASYSSDNAFVDLPLASNRNYTAHFEVGPWRKGEHNAILRQAGLQKPVKVSPPFRRNSKPAAKLKGVVFRAVDIVRQSQVAKGFHQSKWLIARTADPGNQKVLLANARCCPPPLLLKPNLRGVYRILVGTPGAALTLRLSGDPAGIQRHNARLPFHCLLPKQPVSAASCGISEMLGQPKAELDFGIAELDGRTLRLETTRNLYWASRIDYIRFEKLTSVQEETWCQRKSRNPCVDLTGFADAYDIAYVWGGFRRPSPQPFRDNIWNHKRAGYNRIYWRIHGECTDFPTKVGTMRPMLGRAHNVFEPAAKAYSLALQRFDLLKTAVEAAREFDIELYGWIRIASYQSGVKPEFFRDHPEYGEITESGYDWGIKMCYAIPEVRQYTIDILTEAAAYGLQGINLGFLRHPPIVNYHPILVDGYRRKYGRLPPRDMHGKLPAGGDLAHIRTLPEMTREWVRWYQYRADFLTQFGRELRASLKKAGLRHVKVSLWLRPNHCLFDGIDMKAWLNEGLCDEVVADRYVADEDPAVITEPRPNWRRMVQASARMIRGAGFDLAYANKNACRFAKEGYDGFSTYESNEAVINPEWLSIYDSLR